MKKQALILLPSFPGHLLILSYAHGLRPLHTRQYFTSVHVNLDDAESNACFILIIGSCLRRRKNFVWLGGFQICAVTRTKCTRANEFENNNARQNFNKPLSIFLLHVRLTTTPPPTAHKKYCPAGGVLHLLQAAV